MTEDDRRLRVVVTGDNHLSQRLGRLSPTHAQQRRERLRDAFAAVVTAAIERKADIFIQAGDLFDVPNPENRDRAFVAEQFMRLKAAQIATYAVSGNHDNPRQSITQGGVAPLAIYQEVNAVHYFPDAQVITPESLTLSNGLAIAIGGISNDPGRKSGEDPLAEVVLNDTSGVVAHADIGILIVHAAIEGALVGPDECVISEASIRALQGFQVVVTGHIHRYQHRHIGSVDVIVCGPSERMDFGDPPDAPGYAWLEIGASGLLRHEHVRLPAQPRHTEHIATLDIWPPDAPLDGAAERIIQRMEPWGKPDTMVRVILEGELTRPQYQALDMRCILTWGQEHCFSFELRDRDLRLPDDARMVGGDEVMRGERVDPRAVLADLFTAQIAASDDLADADLWQGTQHAVLHQFDTLRADE